MMRSTTAIQVEDLVCPLCGSTKIVTLRGEIARKGNSQECTCTQCHSDFLVSYNVCRKE